MDKIYKTYSQIIIILSLLLSLSFITSCTPSQLPITPTQIINTATQQQNNQSLNNQNKQETTTKTTQVTQIILDKQTSAPQIIKVRPSPGEEIAPNQKILITFDQAINQNKTNTAISLVDSSNNKPIEGTILWVDENSIEFKPIKPLQKGYSYIFNITTEAESRNGIPLEQPFTTDILVADDLQITKVFPENESQDISTDTSITVMFNRPVVPLGVKEEQDKLIQPLNFSPQIVGSGEWLNTSVYVFQPAKPLLSATTYHITIKPNFVDQLGMQLKEEYSWKFTTLSPKIEALELPDYAYNPEDNLTNVPLEQTFLIHFSQPMNVKSVEDVLELKEKNGKIIETELIWEKNNTVLTIKPKKLLNIATSYHLSLSHKAEAEGGGNLGEDFNWHFSTYPLPGVKSSNPKNGEIQKAYSNWYRIEFLSPMDLNSLKGKIIITPSLESQESWSYNPWNWSIEGFGLAPSTRYTIRILPGISDRYGNKTEKEYTITFTTASIKPFAYLQMPFFPAIYRSNDKEMAFYTRWANLRQLDFYLYSISFKEISSFEKGKIADYLPPANSLIKKWSILTEGEKDVRQLTKQSLILEEGKALEPGFYFLAVDSPQLLHETKPFADQRILIISDSNLTIKHNSGSPGFNIQGENTLSNEALVWLTDLDTGKPISNVKINFYDGNLTWIGDGTTNNDGVIHFQKEMAQTLNEGEEDSIWAKSIHYAVTDEKDQYFAFASTDWGSGVSPYDFGVWSDYYEPSEGLNAYIYTERPIYRPSQPVYFKGIVRWNNDLSYEIPKLKEVLIVIENYQETIYKELLTLNNMGSFSGEIKLDKDAALGSYTIKAYIPKSGTPADLNINTEGLKEIGELTFNVAAYRKPEFQVEVSIDNKNILANDSFSASISSTYYSGGAVVGAEIDWKLIAEAYHFIPSTDYSSYSFYDEDLDSNEKQNEENISSIDVIAEGKAKTDDEGKITIPFTADLSKFKTSRLFTFEATLTDEFSNQVTGRAKTIAHRSLLYPGIKTERYLGEINKIQNIEGIVLDWNSNPIANQPVDIEIFERRWSSVQEQNPDGVIEWKSSVENIPVKSFINSKTNQDGKIQVPFTPLKGGTYKILIKTQDNKGNTNQASTFLWVPGKEYLPWRQTNNRSIEVIPDRKSYEVGDIAKILITSPFEDSVYALVTIERGRIHKYEVIQLNQNSTVYSLPITKDMVPNVYLSVIIIGQISLGDQQRTVSISDFRIGMKEISISPKENELLLEVSANKESVEPGDDISYTIHVKDRNGKPVKAELSVSVSDLSTLSLLPMNSLPILDYFYQHRNLGMRTTVPIVLLIDHYNASIQEYITDGKGGGGGGGKGDSNMIGVSEVRENFPDTAYWLPHIMTDAEGKAMISFKFPDNLTTWRLDARAVTEDTKVGQITFDTISTKPLLIKPQTPRFFIEKDKVWVGAVIQNNLKDKIDATVSLEVQGASLIETEETKPAVSNITIPPTSQVYVPWLIEVKQGAQFVDLIFKVNGGGYQDITRPTIGSYISDKGLPVYSYQVPETVGTAGVITYEEAQGKKYAAKTEGIYLPGEESELITPEVKGNLSINIAPSLIAGMKEGLDYLTHYPYECTEQIISKFIPNILTMKTIKALSLEDKSLESNLKLQINTAYQRLSKLQNPDGGWGWWGNQSSDPLTSAYVIFGLIEAKEQGFYANDELISNGVNYLKNNLKALHALTEPSEANRQAFILYVLSKAGNPQPSYVSQLYAARENLSTYGKAYLAMTISMNNSNDERLKTLKSDFMNSAINSASGTHWEEKFNDYHNWNTDTRTTAIVLAALLMIDKDNPINANAVRWLMTNRTQGHWKTTQETMWSLNVLTEWMLLSKETDASYEFTLQLNGNSLIPQGWQQIEQKSIRSLDQLQKPFSYQADISSLQKDYLNQLTIARTAGDGNLYYTAHLNVSLPVEKISPISQGITISRNYYDPSDQRVSIQKTKQGELVFVRLTIISPTDLRYVVIDDPLPAGLEAVDKSLLSSAQYTSPEAPESSYTAPADAPWLKKSIPSWGWQFFDHIELRDEKIILSATTLPKGTYTYTYLARATSKGIFHVIPPTAQEFYFPEVYGRGNGSNFTVE